MVETYGKQTLLDKVKSKFGKKIQIRYNKHDTMNTYGRCINLSVGMLIGLAIDKSLLILLPKVLKFVSFVIPPFSVMLMTKGKILKQIRFDKEFGWLGEKALSHFVAK